MIATPASEPSDDVYDYISDMLAQLADMASEVGSGRLERSLRLLALEAAADGACDLRRPTPRSRRN